MMKIKRFTEQDEYGNKLVLNRHDDWSISFNSTDATIRASVIDKLAEYEDIGLPPEQLKEIDRLYAEKCKELAEVKKKIEELSDEYLQEAQNYANKGNKRLQEKKEHVVFALMRLAASVSD